ncbi:MAG: hypothetical protein ACR2QE_08095 [Acidimicrobiales bacterium]
MNLRDLAANAARTSAGVWQGVANAIDTAPAASAATAEPVRPEARAPDGRAEAMVASGDAMLVPIDSWTRIVDQLANLHQAGQELAEARERAAKAETEAAFLRQQLADSRKGRRRTGESDRSAASEPPDVDLSDPDVSIKPAAHRRAAGYADRTARKALLWIGR